ncbi:MAG: NAD(P)H-hydrate dehydratase [Proteobacteria bacterium]|nr:NAD(P)H-hydrate dehydratase [Pseudomonadota bacterium]
MQPILSVATMQQVDAAATVPVHSLMDAAGYGVALSAARMGIGYGSVVRVLAGSGNNGGDGYVAARYLKRRGVAVVVHQLAPPAPGSAPDHARILAHGAGVPIIELGDPLPANLVIDAVFGTGFHGDLPESVAAWALTDQRVLAVDIPSGLHGDTGSVVSEAFTAERTATFHALMTGHVLNEGPDRCGRIDLHDIGLVGGSPEMFVFESSDVQIPGRLRTGHKWSAGAVATIGGVPGITGAAVLAARSALVSGAGVSSILTTEATTRFYETLAPDIVAIQASESMTWRDHSSEVLSLLGRYDSLVVGPGLEPVSTVFVERLVEQFRGTVIVDAGALNALAKLNCLIDRDDPTILTPHAGEFKRLTGDEPTAEAAGWLAETTGAVVVLKGNPTVVVGDATVIVTNGGPELATIGTGDVLSGMIAALVARGVPAFEAACSAVFIHAEAGSRLAAKRTVTAPTLVDEVARVMAERETRA